MTSIELSSVKKSLNEIILQMEDESSEVGLGELFDHCLKTQDLVECSSLSSNDEERQSVIITCIEALEKCTGMVNKLDLFSSNETIDEVVTSSLRFLLLPAILGYLHGNSRIKNLTDRLKVVEISEVYFKDFLLRCRNYEICSKDLENIAEEMSFDRIDNGHKLSNMKAMREKKISQYKREKEIFYRLEELKPALERIEAEDYQREYYMLLLEKWVYGAQTELESLKRERRILKDMISGGEDDVSEKIKTPVAKPLQPFIITRNEVQKKVFGLGYPSIPVMTIEDFYQQRFGKQIEEQKFASESKSLQERAAEGGQRLDEESEDVQKEQLLEKDDPEALQKARQWDDWKDDNPRGSGNRYNKG